jgi:hypothetical protein
MNKVCQSTISRSPARNDRGARKLFVQKGEREEKLEIVHVRQRRYSKRLNEWHRQLLLSIFYRSEFQLKVN